MTIKICHKGYIDFLQLTLYSSVIQLQELLTGDEDVTPITAAEKIKGK